MIKTYKDLIVWQKATELAVLIYKLTAQFPKDETFGLSSQMKRSSISISSNIAEGRLRSTRPDFTQFLRIALGSAGELESQLVIAKQLSFGDKLHYNTIELLLEEIMKMLNSMISKLKASS